MSFKNIFVCYAHKKQLVIVETVFTVMGRMMVGGGTITYNCIYILNRPHFIGLTGIMVPTKTPAPRTIAVWCLPSLNCNPRTARLRVG